ncbi:hypothetical protein [Spiroplasma ixodetis]|uniref:hypothetical protein n=1 Tax=Spiroplasma ixodetis TaxID=2141 RepID=UPI002574C3A5|nr:hypothetical protein [Spiroplasma ixodetis]WJG70154.1 hypothetical protein SIXOD_v1c12130 [Spiroplasma ixodetis Y32]
MLRSSNILKINSINNFEQLFIFFGLPVLFLLLIMKLTFLITINFHKNSINNKKIFNKTKIIILSFSLWFLVQFCLFLLPVQEMVININFLDLESLPMLSLISILHLFICFSFLSRNNNQIMKLMRFTILSIIIVAIILQFNFTIIKISLPSINNFVSVLILVFFYYWLGFFSWKIFSDNLFTIFNLIKKTWVTLFSNSSLPNIINKQFPVKAYTKTKIIILTWQFKKQMFTNFYHQVSITDNNKKLLIAIFKKNLTYFLSAQLTLLITKTIQDLKTLINGWKMALIQ